MVGATCIYECRLLTESARADVAYTSARHGRNRGVAYTSARHGRNRGVHASTVPVLACHIPVLTWHIPVLTWHIPVQGTGVIGACTHQLCTVVATATKERNLVSFENLSDFCFRENLVTFKDTGSIRFLTFVASTVPAA